jgi:hypothetical protein
LARTHSSPRLFFAGPSFWPPVCPWSARIYSLSPALLLFSFSVHP